MFTAQMARNKKYKSFDQQLIELVDEAEGNTAFVKVFWGPAMERRANEISASLKERGFKVIEIRDLDSFRFAEVHFSWE
jgi:3-methyladenine DNA glycosylase Tag